MASIELAGVSRAFGDVTAVTDLHARRRRRRVPRAAGPERRRQDDDAAPHRRPGAPRRRPHPHGRPRRHRQPARRAATAPSCSSSTRSTRTSRCSTTSPFRCARRCGAASRPRSSAAWSEVAAMLHIEGKLARRATELSGGEMQRVAIGRALVRRPRVFLMDEPLSSLDAQLREELRVELRRLQRSTGATVIYVTHDHVEATTMADRIGILERGVLQQVGTPLEVYGDPRTLPVAQRLGSPAINVLPAQWFDGRSPAGTAHVAIRPEDVVLSPRGRGGRLPGHRVLAGQAPAGGRAAGRRGACARDARRAARAGFAGALRLPGRALPVLRRGRPPHRRTASIAGKPHEHPTHHRRAGGRAGGHPRQRKPDRIAGPRHRRRRPLHQRAPRLRRADGDARRAGAAARPARPSARSA